jgi:hypothetical protein
MQFLGMLGGDFGV